MLTTIAPAVFWISVALIAYTYFLYPALVRLLAHLRPRPVQKADITPSLTLIIAAYNEEKVIRHKLYNTIALDYPPDKLEVLVAAHGSTDGTVAIAQEFACCGVRVLHRAGREGKTAALNRAIAEATGDILMFSDANTVYRADCLRKLVRSFADPSVGGVSGRKIVLADASREASSGETAYWSYEAALKTAESLCGSIVTADGEIFAMRRSLFLPMPASIVHDDMYLSLAIVASGHRLVYENDACSAEYASRTFLDEFHLKSRYASAGYQILGVFRKVLLPPRSWFALEFLSHKLLRWLVPFFLLGTLVASGSTDAFLYRCAFWAQLAFYAAALTGFAVRHVKTGVLYFPFYFSAMNAAALYGFFRFLTTGQSTLWRKAER
ncbi:MAG TPA: glycosyltransferase family 2 protein [Bryobacteraceae bacterium]|nr:glycosyltransferase family 2 protein [Bryobacteraceae bacterium]